ncbi:MAG: hypothetical protein R2825_19000 [Saprospiraceae bacterium]
MLAKQDSLYDKGYQMQFTSNHDENSWSGTEFQRMGDGHKAFAVLTATFNGMPLLYTGMESAMDKQLGFSKRPHSVGRLPLRQFLQNALRTQAPQPSPLER